MKNLQIWDNGGETLDRYTIFKAYERGRIDYRGNKIFQGIAASENGLGFWQHVECLKGNHLGKRVNFNEISETLQIKLINEFQS